MYLVFSIISIFFYFSIISSFSLFNIYQKPGTRSQNNIKCHGVSIDTKKDVLFLTGFGRIGPELIQPDLALAVVKGLRQKTKHLS